MASILTKIQRKVLQGDFDFSFHCLLELAEENFEPSDAVSAILNAKDFDKLTDDESHIRYVLYGYANDGRAMKIVVFLSQRRVFIKTIYEHFN
ncbi:MAG TPA: DUF4258 domain-containing protein [Pyrinomonadaceae bacterium]|nr:DUF4258 domain-containing protein [Pyrinomonadaceae bacterium]